MSDKNLLLVQVYVEYLPKIREAAKKLGWAICIHGSLIRDFDLLAVRWIENASSEDKLLNAIYEAIDNKHANKGREECLARKEHKPHGRVSYDIQIGFGAYIDLSVVK